MTRLSHPYPSATLHKTISTLHAVLSPRAPAPLNAPPPNKTYRPRPKEFSKDRTSIIAVILISTFCAISLFGLLAWYLYYRRLAPMARSNSPSEPVEMRNGVGNQGGVGTKMATKRAVRVKGGENVKDGNKDLAKIQRVEEAERLSAVFEGSTLAGPRNSIVVCGGPMAVLDIECQGGIRDPQGNRNFEKEGLERFCWEGSTQKA